MGITERLKEKCTRKFQFHYYRITYPNRTKIGNGTEFFLKNNTKYSFMLWLAKKEIANLIFGGMYI